MTKTITFKRYSKDSKNCFRFEEVPTLGSPAILGQLYVAKWAMTDPNPQQITVVLTAPDASVATKAQ